MEQKRKFMKRAGKRAAAFVLAAVMAVVLASAGSFESVEAASGGSVTVSVERFVLGQGYLVEPELVPISQGENFALVFDRLMKKHGLTYTHDGRLTDGGGFYLRSIDKADTGKLNIPSCIQNMPGSKNYDGTVVSPPTNTKHTGNIEFPTLGEFAYSSQSGWYYFVNHSAPDVGFSGTKVKNGDVIRVQFTVYGLGADIGAKSDEGNTAALKLPNRDAVTKKMAVVASKKECLENSAWKKAYENALSVVANLDSSRAQVEAAAAALPSEKQMEAWLAKKAAKEEEQRLAKKYTPKQVNLKSVKKSGKNKMKLVWKKVAGATGYQIFISAKKNSGYKKTATLKSAKAATYTKAKLKKGKTYYFKVRAYRKAGKNIYYGKYSNIRSLKMK